MYDAILNLVKYMLTLHVPNIVSLAKTQGCGLWKIEGGHCS